ncbi:Hpt domain-containing protein [Roseovarius sp. PS-C2]|uniref:Hpt domain-containing protein n=1 Tax=Roseovarius sp. PS-C2 TaxID=2820814 RepID=UPI001C0DC777|nr:Hpt domain-containing protein [Roseovarius sp. PS-C2]MBU3260509.1 Hpt domain-containing protein [Roseovarius sp. PS-C2]
MIDWNRVHELRDEIGADEFADVVDLFLEEVESEISALRERDRPDRIEARLHFLKGSALNLGFEDFAALCQTGERMASQGHANKVDITEIIEIYDQSRAAFIVGLRQSDDI